MPLEVCKYLDMYTNQVQFLLEENIVARFLLQCSWLGLIGYTTLGNYLDSNNSSYIIANCYYKLRHKPWLCQYGCLKITVRCHQQQKLELFNYPKHQF